MRDKTRTMCHTALATAVICVLSPIAVPVGGVPVTLSLFAILLVSHLFSARVSSLATLLYVALGAVGVPVFAGFVGGFHVLVGPTGGFLTAYPIIALLTSNFGGTFKKDCIMGVLSAVLCYFTGSMWVAFTTRTAFLVNFAAVFATCAAFDVIKAVCAAFLAKTIKTRSNRSSSRREGAFGETEDPAETDSDKERL